MNTSQFIKILCVNSNISVAELARKCNTSPQNFNQRMKRESFTPNELQEIAETLGCKYIGVFVLPNGKEIRSD